MLPPLQSDFASDDGNRKGYYKIIAWDIKNKILIMILEEKSIDEGINKRRTNRYNN
jgi:hypothetical protein